MISFNTCSRCKMEISEVRRRQSPVICDCCGFVASKAETAVYKNVERSVLKTAVGISVFLVVTFIHVSTWGNHSLDVIPLKAASLFANLNAADAEKMAQIGLDLKKFELTEKMYTRLAQIEPKNFLRLGKFQMSRNEFKEAADSYGQFFARKQESFEARYDYARALGQIGQVDEAAKNFDYVLAAKPGVRQVTVVQNYVKMLVQNQRWDQAQRVIEQVRKRDPSASTFMDTEYKVISERTKSRG